jgi:hypothetical protein
VGNLFLYDSDFKVSEELMFAQWMKTPEKPVPVDDWGGLATAIMGQSRIDKLVLHFHSYDGGLLVGSENKTLDEPSVAALFTKKGAKVPQIDSIAFIGCNLGGRPAAVLAFADLFKTKVTTGYTWFIVHQLFTIHFKKGMDEADVKKALDPFAPYAINTLPAAPVLAKVLLSRDVDQDVFVLYGSRDESFTDIPIAAGKQRTHKPWTQAEPVTILANEARKKEDAFQADPVLPFWLVTIKR